MKGLTKIIPGLIVILFFASCVTQKKRSEEKLTGLKKFYHNVTAEYNGYFNANVLYLEAIDKLNLLHKDNYNKILDLYSYVAVEDGQAVASDMDKAVEKVSIVIALHRQSEWTPDCYLMMGKAQYLKQDYESAEETLEYLADNFNPDEKQRVGIKKKTAKTPSEKKAEAKVKEQTRKQKEKLRNQEIKAKRKANAQKAKERKKARKKGVKTPVVKNPDTAPGDVKNETPQKAAPATTTDNKPVTEETPVGKPPRYFLKHPPCYQEGQLWLARTYMERQDFDRAGDILRALEQSSETPKDVRLDLAMVKGYFYLKQKRYADAVEPLEKALNLLKHRKDKARIAYIIAQINESAGNSDAAYAGYQRVLRFSPSYEMEFNARLNIAINSWKNGKGSAENAIASLEKMTKDIKNSDYLDQIYYAMATIYLEVPDRNKAIESLTSSLAVPSSNPAQQTESYYRLASLYLQSEEYVKAKLYFDSTLTVIPKTDERYSEVSKNSVNLTDIAVNIQIIELQDSLLRIYSMTEKERKELAKKILEERRKAAEAAQKALAAASMPTTSTNAGVGLRGNEMRTLPGAQPGTLSAQQTVFWAYDDDLKKKALRDFEKKWGDRKLEDNWRRSNKPVTSVAGIEEGTQPIREEDINLDEIFRDVPKNESEVTAANYKVMEAMFKLGTLFRDRISNCRKSIETLEQMLSRFPKNPHEPDAWYYLYICSKETNNTAKANDYYNKITGTYPNSTYARVLKDPNYLESSKEEEKKLYRYYDSAYEDFQKGRYKASSDKIARSEEMFGRDNPYKAKFALLNAMCRGNLEGKDAYVSGLREVVTKFPETAESKRAKEMIRLLEGGAPEIVGEDGKPAAKQEETFKVQPDKLHYMIVVLNGKNAKIEEVKSSIANYNREYNRLDELKVTNLFLGSDTNTPIILIRKFNNKEAAMKYYNGVENVSDEFITDAKVEYEVFAISADNYRTLFTVKSVDGYRDFFEENYLNE